MQDDMILILGNVFSCFITTFMVVQYMNEAYTQVCSRRAVYALLQLAVCAGMVLINLLQNPMINLLGWIVAFGSMAAMLYDDYEKKVARRVIEVIVLFMILAVCESAGYVVLEIIMLRMQLHSVQPQILEGFKVTFSKLPLLVLYYFVVIRIWKLGRQIRLTATHYTIYCLIIVYSILNLSLILSAVMQIESLTVGAVRLLFINMIGIVFTAFLFLFFTKFTEENGRLKMELRLLEQQANIQYEYYAAQEEKYNESIAILHDTGRHLNMIEGIYAAEQAGRAKEYTNEIRKILKPLIPRQYTNNPILNILLHDKKRIAKMHGISVTLEIGNADLAFMEPIEVTTIFGNLLDNAIEACQQIKSNQYITLRIDSYRDFIAIHMVNSSSGKTAWRGERPLSRKGGNHGIGLLNVERIVKKYNGSMMLEEKDGQFCCDIILNE